MCCLRIFIAGCYKRIFSEKAAYRLKKTSSSLFDFRISRDYK